MPKQQTNATGLYTRSAKHANTFSILSQENERNRLEKHCVLSRSKATAFSEEKSDDDKYNIRDKKQHTDLDIVLIKQPGPNKTK